MVTNPGEHGARRTVTVREGAALIGCSPSRVRVLIAQGDLPSVKLAGPRSTRIYVEDIEAFLAKLRQTTTWGEV